MGVLGCLFGNLTLLSICANNLVLQTISHSLTPCRTLCAVPYRRLILGLRTDSPSCVRYFFVHLCSLVFCSVVILCLGRWFNFAPFRQAKPGQLCSTGELPFLENSGSPSCSVGVRDSWQLGLCTMCSVSWSFCSFSIRRLVVGPVRHGHLDSFCSNLSFDGRMLSWIIHLFKWAK